MTIRATTPACPEAEHAEGAERHFAQPDGRAETMVDATMNCRVARTRPETRRIKSGAGRVFGLAVEYMR
ncbi:MAG: hypothetical protein OXC25_10280 [Thiotrichales bacterium]|nr:hypothetical protein [Thiotrichales bacterium]